MSSDGRIILSLPHAKAAKSIKSKKLILRTLTALDDHKAEKFLAKFGWNLRKTIDAFYIAKRKKKYGLPSSDAELSSFLSASLPSLASFSSLSDDALASLADDFSSASFSSDALSSGESSFLSSAAAVLTWPLLLLKASWKKAMPFMTRRKKQQIYWSSRDLHARRLTS